MNLNADKRLNHCLNVTAYQILISFWKLLLCTSGRNFTFLARDANSSLRLLGATGRAGLTFQRTEICRDSYSNDVRQKRSPYHYLFRNEIVVGLGFPRPRDFVGARTFSCGFRDHWSDTQTGYECRWSMSHHHCRDRPLNHGHHECRIDLDESDPSTSRKHLHSKSIRPDDSQYYYCGGVDQTPSVNFDPMAKRSTTDIVTPWFRWRRNGHGFWDYRYSNRYYYFHHHHVDAIPRFVESNVVVDPVLLVEWLHLWIEL